MRTKLYAFLLLFFLTALLFPQSADEQYKSIANIKDNKGRIEALKKFIAENPGSTNITGAYANLFNIYLNENQTDSALVYADKYTQSLPAQSRGSAYNSVAYTLGVKGAGLDTARAYITRAVAEQRESNGRQLNAFVDTEALIYFKLGKADTALVLEQEAIKGNEDDPDYLLALATYQFATGDKATALNNAVKVYLLSGYDEAVAKLKEWKADGATITGEINNYINTLQENEKLPAKSRGAALLASTGGDVKTAEQWAKDAAGTLNKNSSVEEILEYNKNLAVVYAASGKNSDALTILKKYEELASPYDVSYWTAYAQVYLNQGKEKEALDSYLNILYAYPVDNIKADAEKLAAEQNKDLNALVEQKKNSVLEFEPGKYKGGKESGHVVLAELFTGAECPPCVGADGAFDHLAEYYPRDKVIILEYHLHIPGPDPLTNPDTYKKYVSYGGDFGTPTVFFDGQNKLTGGGPKIVALNRFNTYNYAIKEYLDEKPQINIKGTAKKTGGSITVSANLNGSIKDSSVINIALVEKYVDYTGGNGVSKHLFVVRDLVNGADGMPLELKNGKQTLTQTLNLDEIKKGITEYLNDPTRDPSWRARTAPQWRKKTDDINYNNLAVVVWVQEKGSRKVLQSFYTDVK